MCRRNQLWGFNFIAFGLGLLIGCSIESGFWCCILGIGLIISGFVACGKK